MGVDFLTGMTLFILSLFFVFQLMFGVIEPYTSTSKENVEIANRAVDKLYYSGLTESDTPTGYLNYTETMDFFQNMSESEIRASLAIPDVKGYNITLLSDYTNYEPRTDLVAYWSMNERNGGTVEDMAFAGDISDTGRLVGDADLTANGVMSTTAVSFDGDSGGGTLSSPGDYVNVSPSDDFVDLADGSNLTVSAWVYRKTDQGGPITVLNKTNSTGGAGFRLYIENDQPVFGVNPNDPSGTEVPAVNTNLQPGRWYHVVGAYSNTSNDMRIYVNGQWRGGAGTPGLIYANPNTSLRIGASGPSGSRHLNGRVDEVRLYNSYLNGSQVQELYNTSGRLSPDDPKLGDPLKNTTLDVGGTPPDISSVSTRRRVAYITSRGINDTKDVGTVIIKAEVW